MFISAAVNTAQSEVMMNLIAVRDEVLRSLAVVKPLTPSWYNRTEFIRKHSLKRTRQNGALRYRVHLMAILVLCGFGGLGVACWPLVPKFAGSNPAEAFLRRGSKAVGPMS
jgi:hypothetical protein